MFGKKERGPEGWRAENREREDRKTGEGGRALWVVMKILILMLKAVEIHFRVFK